MIKKKKKRNKLPSFCSKFKNIGISGNDALHEFEYIQKLLHNILYDWGKVANYMIGLWENYVGNPEVPEDKKEEVSVWTPKSVYALRELSENRRYLKNCHALVEQLIFEIKEKNLNFE